MHELYQVDEPELTEGKWFEKNKSAIEAYNEFVAENGCFSDDYRDF